MRLRLPGQGSLTFRPARASDELSESKKAFLWKGFGIRYPSRLPTCDYSSGTSTSLVDFQHADYETCAQRQTVRLTERKHRRVSIEFGMISFFNTTSANQDSLTGLIGVANACMRGECGSQAFGQAQPTMLYNEPNREHPAHPRRTTYTFAALH
jgi:hypothetical protein